jgi:hypothetical protein
MKTTIFLGTWLMFGASALAASPGGPSPASGVQAKQGASTERILKAYRRSFATLPRPGKGRAVTPVETVGKAIEYLRANEVSLGELAGAASRESLLEPHQQGIAALATEAQAIRDTALKGASKRTWLGRKLTDSERVDRNLTEADKRRLAQISGQRGRLKEASAARSRQLDDLENGVRAIDDGLKSLPSTTHGDLQIGSPYGNAKLRDVASLTAEMTKLQEHLEHNRPTARVARLEAVLHERLNQEIASQRGAFEQLLQHGSDEALAREAASLINGLDQKIFSEDVRRIRTGESSSSSFMSAGMSSQASSSWSQRGLFSRQGGSASSSSEAAMAQGSSSESYTDTLLPGASTYRIIVGRSRAGSPFGKNGAPDDLHGGTTPFEARKVLEKTLRAVELVRALRARQSPAYARFAKWMDSRIEVANDGHIAELNPKNLERGLISLAPIGVLDQQRVESLRASLGE